MLLIECFKLALFKGEFVKLQTRDIMIGLVSIGLSAMFAFSEEPFFDNFDRRNGKPDNDWIVNSPEVKTEIKDKEILIHGTEKTNWKRNGIERLVDDVNKVCFDFLNNDVFNVHLRVDDDKSGTNAYIDIYSPPGPQGGNNFNYASPADGAWPGWTNIGGAPFEKNPRKEGYRQLCLRKEQKNFFIIVDNKEIAKVKNAGLLVITKVFISIDAAAGRSGSMHVDNVDIDDAFLKGSKAVGRQNKLPILWSALKRLS
tara:strand:- start:75 stop:842 length:768 start_codon:yes stop_codon:yes gene_type:complete